VATTIVLVVMLGARPGGGAADSTTEGATSGRPGDDVVDADFEVVDDDKKKS